jgi:hypothetical protein
MKHSHAETDTAAPHQPHLRIPVTLSALVQRLRRHHARQYERFCITRGTRWFTDLGYWHVVDDRNFVACSFSSRDGLIEHAREVKCLAAWESVEVET